MVSLNGLPLTCALAMGMLCPCMAFTQASGGSSHVVGTIVDEFDRPVEGVEVYSLRGGAHALSGSRGQFVMHSVTPGSQRLVARRPGFMPDTTELVLSANDSVAVWVVLKSYATTLNEMIVRAQSVAPRLAGFEDRRLRSTGGHFITPDDIDAQSPTETTDLLRRVTGLRLEDSSHVLVPVSNRGFKVVAIGKKMAPVQCVMRIGVNGFLQDAGFALNSISPRDIHGIEIYSGPATIPPVFNSGSAADMYCGLIMIWTKSG